MVMESRGRLCASTFHHGENEGLQFSCHRLTFAPELEDAEIPKQSSAPHFSLTVIRCFLVDLTSSPDWPDSPDSSPYPS